MLISHIGNVQVNCSHISLSVFESPRRHMIGMRWRATALAVNQVTTAVCQRSDDSLAYCDRNGFTATRNLMWGKL